MTEQDWLQVGDPISMLEYVQASATDRKLRLFSIACYRAWWDKIEDENAKLVVEFAERLADEKLTKRERKLHNELFDDMFGDSEDGQLFVGGLTSDSMHHTYHVVVEAYGSNAASVISKLVLDSFAWGRARPKERRRQCNDIRDIFGNPFRPMTFDPKWQTPTVTAMAQAMYEDRDFTAMPILGDALEEAGCINEDILQHCRGMSGHVRGCWVVDLLRKS